MTYNRKKVTTEVMIQPEMVDPTGWLYDNLPEEIRDFLHTPISEELHITMTLIAQNNKRKFGDRHLYYDSSSNPRTTAEQWNDDTAFGDALRVNKEIDGKYLRTNEQRQFTLEEITAFRKSELCDFAHYRLNRDEKNGRIEYVLDDVTDLYDIMIEIYWDFDHEDHADQPDRMTLLDFLRAIGRD